MDYAKLKGTYDIAPKESDFFRYLETTIEAVIDSYGFKKVVFPVIEYASLFTRGVGESSDIVVKKEMYMFEDRGHRMIALRPEGTASAVRLYLENGLAMQGYSAKMYYIGPMFRAENPQAGRYRQFTQFGVEYIGDSTPYADVELIALNRDIFEKLGIKDFTIYINTIGCRECRPVHLERLKKYFADKIKDMCTDCQKRYETNVLRILDCKEEKCRSAIEKAPSMLDSLCGVCQDHFTTTRKALDILKIAYQIDERLVRGLDYYNRTVFEIKSGVLGAQSTVSAGGRYDYLVKELGGMETPAAGFAIGLERLAMTLEATLQSDKKSWYNAPEVYIAFIGDELREKALEIVSILRGEGISTVTEYRYSNLKKHLKSADSMKAKHALMVGEDELKAGRFTLRNLGNGEQWQLTMDEIIKTLKTKA